MLKLKCPKHPRYSGAESPRCSCAPCQIIQRLRLEAETNRLEVVK